MSSWAQVCPVTFSMKESEVGRGPSTATAGYLERRRKTQSDSIGMMATESPYSSHEHTRPGFAVGHERPTKQYGCFEEPVRGWVQVLWPVGMGRPRAHVGTPVLVLGRDSLLDTPALSALRGMDFWPQGLQEYISIV